MSSQLESAFDNLTLSDVAKSQNLPVPRKVKKHSNKTSLAKEQELRDQLLQFYTKPENAERFKHIISTGSPSLRSLDYFVVNYCKSHNVSYVNSTGRLFEVHASYKEVLADYHKSLFDAFRRKQRYHLKIDNQSFETTLGQLQFFRWAFQNGVIEYVERHASAISEDMLCNEKKKEALKMARGTDTTNRRRKARQSSTFQTRSTRIPSKAGRRREIVKMF